jgi:hypothetical protein
LQLTSNESTFEYSFPQEFFEKNYEVALIKLDGTGCGKKFWQGKFA